ncbi:MAG: hypothetical protein IH945_01945 [Armatimonadetes bacterium]|nr:hypothetical protein [Armatimonadota bacterium]
MSYNTDKDVFFEIAKGNVPGHRAKFIFAFSPNIADGMGEVDLWGPAETMSYVPAAERLNIKSTDAQDNPAGAGARNLLLVGLVAGYVEEAETVVMDGTDDVLTAKAYIRPPQIAVFEAGGAGHNVGLITAISETSGFLQSHVEPTTSLSFSSHYTVPAGKIAFVNRIEMNAGRTKPGTSPTVVFRGYRRDHVGHLPLRRRGRACLHLVVELPVGPQDHVEHEVVVAHPAFHGLPDRLYGFRAASVPQGFEHSLKPIFVLVVVRHSANYTLKLEGKVRYRPRGPVGAKIARPAVRQNVRH